MGDKFSLGIYDTHIKIRGAPWLVEHEQTGPVFDKLQVNEVMADRLVTLKPVSAVSDIVQALCETTHGAFPVTPVAPRVPGEPFELHGTITRGVLLKLLHHRVGFMWGPFGDDDSYHRNEGSFHAGPEGLHRGCVEGESYFHPPPHTASLIAHTRLTFILFQSGLHRGGVHSDELSSIGGDANSPTGESQSKAFVGKSVSSADLDLSGSGAGSGERYSPSSTAQRKSKLFESASERSELLETLKQIPFKPPPIAELVKRLTPEELRASINIAPFMQRHPFIVHADARLSRAYRLFRTMGLRHMYITPEKPMVVGVVTRKDLSEENAALTLGERAADSAREYSMDDANPFHDGVSSNKDADDEHGPNSLFRDKSGNNHDLPFLPYYPGNVDTEDLGSVEMQTQVVGGGALPEGSARRRGR